MKDPERYEAREPSDEVPDPIKCDVASLNMARTECRKGMTLILEEVRTARIIVVCCTILNKYTD